MGMASQMDELVMEIASINHERYQLRLRGAALDLDEARMLKALATLAGGQSAPQEQGVAG